MTRKYTHPFEGKPRTDIIKREDGSPEVRLTLTALSPFGARCRNVLRVWIPVIVSGFQVLSLLQYSYVPLEVWLKSLAWPWLLYPASHLLFSWLLADTARIVLTQKDLSFSAGGDWRHYPRAVPHEIAAITHDKQDQEHIKRIPLTKRYYTQSRTITFLIYGQRCDILNVFNIRKAQAFLARIQACEEWIDSTCQRGAGLSLHSEDDFSLQPGNIINAGDLFREIQKNNRKDDDKDDD